MARDRLRNPHLQGVVVLDKPAGLTSQQVVSRARAAMRIDKMGHGGTLDPFATGVLPLLVNSATRIAPLLGDDDKVYRGVMRLGVTTDTLDPTGKVLQERPVDGVTADRVAELLREQVGEIEQIPPMYSAVKVDGKRLYELARKDVEVERRPKRVTIHDAELLGLEGSAAEFRIHCSSGTYVRVIVQEIGDALGCGAHLERLVRERSGRFVLEDALGLEDLDDLGVRFRDDESAHEPEIEGRRWRWPHPEATAWWVEHLGGSLRPLTEAVDAPRLRVGAETARRLRQGEPLRAGDLGGNDVPTFAAGDTVLITQDDDRVLALMRATCRGDLAARMPARSTVLQPRRILLPRH